MPLPDVMVGNDEALYNIGIVARMTGITLATLRAWERRYDFPNIDRTSGGHRLYSEKNLMQLLWVKERINEGMQTAQAINALRHQEQSGRLIFTELETKEAQKPLIGVSHAEIKDYLHIQQDRLFKALTDNALDKAEEILSETLAGSNPEQVILEVIPLVLERIGEGWENGDISISTEHQSSNYLRQRLLMWMVSGPPAKYTRPIILACAPGEWHEGSLLILGALLRRRRWPIIYLGQSVPIEDLVKFMQSIRPSLVVLVAMTNETAEALSEWPRFMPHAIESGTPIVGFGGKVFVEQPIWQSRVQGVYLGDTYEEGVNKIENLLSE